MERLKVVPAWLLATERHIFTFQYGEIKRILQCAVVFPVKYLHSSMERLKGPGSCVSNCCSTHLHSSMERLKVSGEGERRLEMLIFTFQYGEIKRRTSWKAGYRFQNLHSSMERLKGSDTTRAMPASDKFTFQYGEIKSHKIWHP